MRRLASALAVLAFTGTAAAEEIVRAGPGCTDRDFAERMFDLRDVQKDIRAFGLMVDDGRERGICQQFKIGQSVTVEQRGLLELSCVRRPGEPACYWILPTMVE